MPELAFASVATAFIRIATEHDEEFDSLLSAMRSMGQRSTLAHRHIGDIRSLATPATGRPNTRLGAIRTALAPEPAFSRSAVTDFAEIVPNPALPERSRELFLAAVDELRQAALRTSERDFLPAVVVRALRDEAVGPHLESALLNARSDFNLMTRLQRHVLPMIVRVPVGDAIRDAG